MYKLFASSLIFIVAILSCGGDSVVSPDSVPERYIPEVRLVDDGSNDFHFQWDAPLKEERIIAVRYYYFFSEFEEVPEKEEALRVVELEFDNALLYFPKDSSISKPYHISSLHSSWRNTVHTVAIEILSAKQRDVLELPAPAWSGEHHWKDSRHDRLILREHPFKPYRVGTSSRLNRSIKGYKFIGLFSD